MGALFSPLRVPAAGLSGQNLHIGLDNHRSRRWVERAETMGNDEPDT